MIPELERAKEGSGRLRGLRLLHTHLNKSPLSHEDLMDLLFLRLDSIGLLTVDEHGMPLQFQYAHLLPQHADLQKEQATAKKNEKQQKLREAYEKKQKFLRNQENFENQVLLVEHLFESPENHKQIGSEKNLSSQDIINILNKELYKLPSQDFPDNNFDESASEKSSQDFDENIIIQNELETKSPYFVSQMFPWDSFTHDFSGEVEALEEEFTRLIRISQQIAPHIHGTHKQNVVKKNKVETLQAGSRAVLVSVGRAPKSVQEQNLKELSELARTAGLVIAGSLIQRVTKVHPRQILSQNKLAELEVIALQGHAGIIIFDGELSPAQLHNVAELTERKVLDRTQLILDIFAQHAKTSAGKLQVEMAQLKYTQPRLAGKNEALDRLKGGIGGRGPGETKLETDRRRIRDRIARIKNELESLKRQRQANRSKRTKQELPLAALVGYTNAGKSTLLNYLTKSDVIAENKLFATLDPTTRRLRFPKEREMVLADTVGFIRELPKELIEAFRATLEELDEADLLIHVVDASHPEMDAQLEAVENILKDLGLQDIPVLLLLNKWENVSRSEQFALLARFPKAFPISAINGTGLDKATKHIENLMF